MSTSSATPNASSVLFGQTRRAVLVLLFGHADESFYVRQIARRAGASLGAVQRELKQLHHANIIRRAVRGHQVYYQANSESPIFKEMKSLLAKTAGVHDVLREALVPLAGQIQIAFIYGSVGRSEERADSDVDLMVVGSVSFEDLVASLERAEKALAREVNPTVYPVAEFQKKVRSGHHFLSSVLKQDKIFVIGSERELSGVASKRLARSA